MAGSNSIFRGGRLIAAAALALAAGGGLGGPALAQAVDEATIQRGMLVWRDVAICRYCHGWDAKGALVEGYPPATPLVSTILDRDQLIEAVACGRPRPGMPRHRADAWTKEYPCYGMLKEDIGADFPDPPQRRFLSQREIEDVVDFVIVFYKSGEMSYENCQKYYAPSGSRLCDQYKK